jgi:hypothetical protein
MGRRRPPAIEAKPRLECATAGWRVIFQRQNDDVGARCHIDGHPDLRSQSLIRRSMAEKMTAVQAAAPAHAAHSLC